jgi:AcrR family transcriptional regulator
VARTQEERKTETRARLVESAAKLFAEQGIDAVSVDAVADAAERTSGAIYAHFGSKQGLLLAILDEWKYALVATLGAEFEQSPDAEGRLRAIWANYAGIVDPQARRPLLLDAELWLRAARDPEVGSMLHTRYVESRDWIARGLAQWIAEGLIDPELPPHALAGLFKALLTGMAMQRQVDPDAFSDDDALYALATLIRVRGDPPPGTPHLQHDGGRSPAH